MKLFKINVLLLLSFFSITIYAESANKTPSTWDKFFQGIAEDMRPTLVEAIGEKWTNRLLGPRPVAGISLPKIPELKKDARSVTVFDKVEEQKSSLKEEQVEKLRYHYLNELFSVTLRRQANDEELSKWMNTLQQGASLEGIFRALVLNKEYDSLEKDQNIPNQALVDYVKNVLVTYTNTTVSDDALKGMNVFGLKRIVIEKCFEVMDALKKNPEELTDWYAVFSQDQAKHFGPLFTEEVRKNPEASFHKQWSKKWPADFLKMEVVIKLSMIMHQL
jgi:hypothetical protein